MCVMLRSYANCIPWDIARTAWTYGLGHAHLVAIAAYPDVKPTSAPPPDHVDHGARLTRTAPTIPKNLSITVALGLRSCGTGSDDG